MPWFLLALKNYATFTGRSQRSEYWYFVLFYLVIYIGLSLLDGLLGTYSGKAEIGLLSALFAIATLLPSIAVTARRLHDIGKSGWWQLIAFIPLIGALLLLVWLARDSESAGNSHGPNPKTAIA